MRTFLAKIQDGARHLLRVGRVAVKHFTEVKAPYAAAALAYYAFFSLFPLLLLLIAATSAVFTAGRAQQEVVTWVQQALPISQSLVERNVEQVWELRGTVGVIGLLSLLWSATGVFNTLTYNISRAWREGAARGFFARRLVALLMVLALLALLLLSLASSTLARLLPRLEIPLLDVEFSIYDTFLWGLVARLIPWTFTLLLFLALYRWVPNVPVGWWPALGGAGFAAVAWELAKSGFALYLRSGLVRYELVYGSLGTVVALLFWIYISALITLFGAHLSAALDQPPAEPEEEASPPERRVFVVLNPVAGTSDPEAVRAALTEYLDKAGWDYEIYETREGEDPLDAVRAAREEGYELFVAAGGDGTVGAVASGLVDTGVPVAIVPTGTGNTLARELDVPLDLDAACRLLTGEHGTHAVDALEVGERYFFLNLSVGVSALAIEETERTSKRRLGMLAYILAGTRTLLGAQPARFTLEVDGETHDVRASDVVIANSGAVGFSDTRLGRELRFDDGVVNVVVIRARSGADYARLAWGVLFGQPQRDPNLRFFEARETIAIEARRSLPVQADGEALGHKTVRARVVPGAVRFVAPHSDY